MPCSPRQPETAMESGEDECGSWPAELSPGGEVYYNYTARAVSVVGGQVLRVQDVVEDGKAHLHLEAHKNYAGAVRFIKENTTIPVPEVYRLGTVGGRYEFMYLEKMEGTPLPDDDDAVIDENLVAQILAFREQLRSIKSDVIRGFGPEQKLTHPRVTCLGIRPPVEPCGSVVEYLIRRLGIIERPHVEPLDRLIRHLESGAIQIEPCDIVLCHGDFSACNILAKDGKVTALLDWEYAGFYPEYHEDYYTYKNEPLHYLVYSDAWRAKFPTIAKIEDCIRMAVHEDEEGISKFIESNFDL